MRVEFKKKYLFSLIILLSLVLRFFKLGSVPPSLYWDEASLGYNAYSVLKTGRDEFGIKFPLDKFIAFGDYKPVGYIYATIAPIALFGLNEFAVRFPSALAGTLMVVLSFFLARKLLGNPNIALVSAFLLAISPWSLHLSRAAFESNLAAFFNLLAIFCFIKGAREKGYWLIFSIFSFVAAFYTFNSNRVLLPIFLVILAIIYFKDLLGKKKWFLASLFLGFFLLVPLLPYLRSRESKLRYHEVNIFSNLDVVVQSNERIFVDGGTRLARIIHHRYISHALNFLKHYFDHYSFEFLFVSGDVNPRLSIRNIGELYLVELPFFLIGLYFIILNLKKKSYLLILVWFLTAPLPAALARETPHALRILSILPTPQIISALGFYHIFEYLKGKKIASLLHLPAIGLRQRRWQAGCFIASLLFFNFVYYLYSYYFIFPKIYASSWLDGYKQAVRYIEQVEKDYEKIYVTNYYARPYIYFLFYQKYPPEKYFKEVKRDRDWFGNWTVYAFDKFEFSDELRESRGRILYLAPPNKTLPSFAKIGEIKRSNGETTFWLLEKG